MLRAMSAAIRPQKQASSNSGTSYPGFYRGTVIARNDPELMGRVKVRVPMIHGDQESTPTDLLPWAQVYSMGGGTQDTGGYDQPLIGIRVLVIFEAGMAEKPLIISTFRAKPTRPVTITPPVPATPVVIPPGNEKPFEVLGFDDTKIIWHKTWKGHTIMCEELAGTEYIRIIDRGGNTIELKSPMGPAALRRGIGNAVDGTAVTAGAMVGESHILLKDVSGQEVRMTATPTPQITLTTTGKIKLGSVLASLGVAIALPLSVALNAFVATVKGHTHLSTAPGSPTGPAVGVGDVSGGWTSIKVDVES